MLAIQGHKDHLAYGPHAQSVIVQSQHWFFPLSIKACFSVCFCSVIHSVLQLWQESQFTVIRLCVCKCSCLMCFYCLFGALPASFWLSKSCFHEILKDVWLPANAKPRHPLNSVRLLAYRLSSLLILQHWIPLTGVRKSPVKPTFDRSSKNAWTPASGPERSDHTITNASTTYQCRQPRTNSTRTRFSRWPNAYQRTSEEGHCAIVRGLTPLPFILVF